MSRADPAAENAVREIFRLTAELAAAQAEIAVLEGARATDQEVAQRRLAAAEATSNQIEIAEQLGRAEGRAERDELKVRLAAAEAGIAAWIDDWQAQVGGIVPQGLAAHLTARIVGGAE